MKAFFGRSFQEKDEQLVTKIAEMIEALDVDCVNAKPAKSKQVNDKVKELILGCDIFVGIFTCDQPICQTLKTKWYCKPKMECNTYTTSNWVIQESGFAIGSGRDLLLFVENGVDSFPKLQGDLEYIPFDRNNIEAIYPKIAQLISDIKGKTTRGATEKSSGELTSPIDTKPEEHEGQPKKEIQDEKEEVLNKIYEALWKDNNYIEAQRIFDDEAEALIDEDDRVPIRAWLLRVSHSLGDESAFEKLQKMARENAENPRVIKHLAHRYKEMSEFNKAKEQFLLATEKYDVADVGKKSGLIDANVQAAWCLADDDDLNGALELLRKLLFDSNFLDSKARIFKAMSEISKDKDDIERFYVYAEAALDIDPSDTNLRFTLAYAYSFKDLKLSLLHYKKLTDTTVHSMALNNLGAQYSDLTLKGKSINSFYKAADNNETLAMANLAQKYLNEGFIKDAREIVDRAIKLSNEGIKLDYRVGDAQKRIKDLTNEENKKEQKLLLEAEKERKFRVEYAKVFCSDKTVRKNEIEGCWETPWGDGQLTFDEESNSFQLDISIEKADTSGYIVSLLGGNQQQQKVVYKTEHLKIKGHVNYLSGRYTVDAGDKRTTILTGETEHEREGYMIIDEKCNTIDVMEKKKGDKVEFVYWKKRKN